MGDKFDFEAHLQRQRVFSERTFGPGPRAKGVVNHIRRELVEVEAKPSDLSEWIDVAILALDGAWRTGATPRQIIEALVAKQTKNEARNWPDWRTFSEDAAIEHDRTKDLAPGQRVHRRGDPVEVGDLIEIVTSGTHRARVRWDHITSGAVAHVRLDDLEVASCD